MTSPSALSTGLPTEVERILATLLAEMRRILGEKLAGLYLSGSLVWGDYDPEISDIDLVAILTSELTEDEFACLHAMHQEAIARHSTPTQMWEDRLEVAYVTTAALRNFRTVPYEIAILPPGEPFHRITGGKDWLMNWYLVRTRGRTCFGPPPATWIDPIAKAEFVTATRDHARAWPVWIEEMRELPWQSYAVLTLCRALYTHQHGEQVSKVRAAAWVAAQWPQWADLTTAALVWRKDYTAADPVQTFAVTRAFVHFAVAQIDLDKLV
jgi:hypothetical protein